MPIPFASLSDIELVRALFDARTRSPVIEELCRRIEENPNNYEEAPEVYKLTCPICQADLTLDTGEIEKGLT